MKTKAPQRIKTISEFHRIRQLPKPLHPLISLVDYSLVRHSPDHNEVSWIQDFYSIGLKRNVCGKFRYGHQEYDFDEGLMSFIAPGQVFRIEVIPAAEDDPHPSGWLLLFHPDFLWNTPLASRIHQYEFFGYKVNESLFLSDKEEQIILEIMKSIEREYRENIDSFTQSIIISQLETLLNYADRFYQRQFTTRKITNHRVLDKLEELLSDYFNSDRLQTEGIPTVGFVAAELNASPNYLTGLLKSLTGKNTQQHIQDKLLEKAKERLTTTDLTVSEIAFELGFEHSQSFSKFFRAHTTLSPKEYRQSFIQ